MAQQGEVPVAEFAKHFGIPTNRAAGVIAEQTKRLQAMHKQAEMKQKANRLQRQGRLQAACCVEGGCRYPDHDIRQGQFCCVCKKDVHNLCADECGLRCTATQKLYCSRNCFNKISIS